MRLLNLTHSQSRSHHCEGILAFRLTLTLLLLRGLGLQALA